MNNSSNKEILERIAPVSDKEWDEITARQMARYKADPDFEKRSDEFGKAVVEALRNATFDEWPEEKPKGIGIMKNR